MERLSNFTKVTQIVSGKAGTGARAGFVVAEFEFFINCNVSLLLLLFVLQS
jgi:hypothetical protein